MREGRLRQEDSTNKWKALHISCRLQCDEFRMKPLVHQLLPTYLPTLLPTYYRSGSRGKEGEVILWLHSKCTPL